MNGLTLVPLTAVGVVACTSGTTDDPFTGQFATAEIEEVVKESVADNGLVSMRPASHDNPVDLMATSVLHRAGVAGLPQPRVDALDDVCTTYGATVPQPGSADVEGRGGGL